MTAGNYIRGKGYTQDKPKEQLEEDQVNIMKSGAYGAFVHGLEDEFLGENIGITSILVYTIQIYPYFCFSFLL